MKYFSFYKIALKAIHSLLIGIMFHICFNGNTVRGTLVSRQRSQTNKFPWQQSIHNRGTVGNGVFYLVVVKLTTVQVTKLPL
jgi:hypothetical protein